MSQRCACGSKAHGSVGALALCRYCLAEMSGLDQKAFRKPVEIELHNEGKHVGRTLWVPWSFHKRQAGEAEK